MFEIFKEFTIEAAHQLAVNVGDGHPYARLHGHSFKVEIFLRGEADPMTNWVDFGKIDRRLQDFASVRASGAPVPDGDIAFDDDPCSDVSPAKTIHIDRDD